MIKRLLIQFPLYIIFFCLVGTIVIPIIYWIITGNSPFDWVEEMEERIGDL